VSRRAFLFLFPPKGTGPARPFFFFPRTENWERSFFFFPSPPPLAEEELSPLSSFPSSQRRLQCGDWARPPPLPFPLVVKGRNLFFSYSGPGSKGRDWALPREEGVSAMEMGPEFFFFPPEPEFRQRHYPFFLSWLGPAAASIEFLADTSFSSLEGQ